MIGFLNIYKPSKESSAYTLNKIKKALKEKVGHMGTLDPLASGVLLVAVGKATRLFDYLLDKEKRYIAEFTFGYQTDALDLDGKIILEGGRIPTLYEINEAVKKQIGVIDQIPPSFSAKNINGTRSYVLARRGEEVQLQSKKVEILSIKAYQTEKADTFKFDIVCKGGTYIRSICRDLAKELNTYATMTKLERVASGCFSAENSHTVEEVLNSKNVEELLIKPEKVLTLLTVNLNEKEYLDLINGRALLLDENDGFYSAFYNGKLICVCEIKNKSTKIKAYLE